MVKVTIQIKDSFFSQFEHLFVWNKYMKLRPSDQYAATKLMGNKEQIKSGMLLWSKVERVEERGERGEGRGERGEGS